MNTQVNDAGSRLDSPAVTPAAAISWTRLLLWSVRRELWENRSIYLAPVAVAGVILLGFLIALIHMPRPLQTLMAEHPMPESELVRQPYEYASGIIMGTVLIVALFYCLDALYGERRERSILFWKSLPVSDLTTVLSKISIPMVVLPVVCVVVTAATQWIMLLLNSAGQAARGQSLAALWSNLPLARMDVGLFYHLVAMHVLWHAPIYAYLLLVSAWARRATFLWAFVPPLGVGILEKIVFNTSYFADMLSYRFSGDKAVAAATAGNTLFDPMTHLTPGVFLGTPGLWIGLLVAAAFLAAAVRLRRHQGPI